MRVIAGIAGGRKISSLPGLDVRPTAEKVKEAIFSSIQFDLEGRRFLDLFAGCGQMGIEALSRGAKSATFVDNSAVHLKTVKENLAVTGLQFNAKVICADFASFLSTCSDTFDIAFLDPPYYEGLITDALLETCQVMSAFGKILCEHPKEISLPDTVNDFYCYKEYNYGKIVISAYRRKEHE